MYVLQTAFFCFMHVVLCWMLQVNKYKVTESQYQMDATVSSLPDAVVFPFLQNLCKYFVKHMYSAHVFYKSMQWKYAISRFQIVRAMRLTTWFFSVRVQIVVRSLNICGQGPDDSSVNNSR